MSSLEKLNNNFATFSDSLIASIDKLTKVISHTGDFSLQDFLATLFATLIGAWFAFYIQSQKENRHERVKISSSVNEIIQTNAINLEFLLSFKNQFLKGGEEFFSKLKNHANEYDIQRPMNVMNAFAIEWNRDLKPQVNVYFQENPGFHGLFQPKFESPWLLSIPIEKLAFLAEDEGDIVRLQMHANMAIKSFQLELSDREKFWHENLDVLKNLKFEPHPEFMRVMFQFIVSREHLVDFVDRAVCMMHSANILLQEYHKNNLTEFKLKKLVVPENVFKLFVSPETYKGFIGDKFDFIAENWKKNTQEQSKK